MVKARKELRRIQSIPERGFQQHVEELRMAIADYHLRNNACYRSIAKKTEFRSWEEVPVMTKADLQRPLEERLSDGFSSRNVYVNKTSGSSGHPFVFAKDKFSHAMTWAVIMNRYNWYGLDFHKSKQARFYGIPLDRWGHSKERIKDWLSNRYRFPIFDLSDDILSDYFDEFKKRKFDYIYGYTNSIVLFAKYLDERGLILQEFCPSLKYCITTSEMLFDKDKALLEKVLGVPVINEYGASELDLIAFTNPEGEFQLNSETLFVEILDDNGRCLPDGQEGRIAITSLFNKAHPMLRYDIGDSGIIDRSAGWKRPILKRLLGRTSDVAILPNGKRVPGLTFYYVTKSIIEDDSKVREFVIEQQDKDSFIITYASAEALQAADLDKIKQALNKYVGSGLDLKFIRKDKIERSASGKLKQFSSKIIEK